MARPANPPGENREDVINVRAKFETTDKFYAACTIRGTKMSDELHRYMVSVIREEEAANPKLMQQYAKQRSTARDQRKKMATKKSKAPAK